MSTIQHSRPIMVLTLEEGLWVSVCWNGDRFLVVGEDSWVWPNEVQDWREAPWPAIGVGAPK